MVRATLVTCAVSVTMLGVAANAQTPTSTAQPGYQPRYYSQPQAVAPQPAYGARVPYQPGYAHGGWHAGDITMQVQHELAMVGYDPGPIDGVGGPRTRQAILAYQAHNGLSADGMASPALLDHLRSHRMQTSGTLPRQGQLDSEAPRSLQRVQSGYQPKYYQQQPPSADETHGPGVTYPYSHPPVAAEPGRVPPGGTYAATQPPMTQPGSQPKLHQERVEPGAAYDPYKDPSVYTPQASFGQPAGTARTQPGSQPKFYLSEPQSTDPAALNRTSPAAGGSHSFDAAIQRCRQIGDPTARANCEAQAHRNAMR